MLARFCVFVSLLFCPSLVAAQVGWYPIKDFGSQHTILHVLTDSRLFAASTLTDKFSDTAIQLLETTDGGSHWEIRAGQIEPPKDVSFSGYPWHITLNLLHFTDTIHATLAGTMVYSAPIGLYFTDLFAQTIDAGNSWSHNNFELHFGSIPIISNTGNFCGNFGILPYAYSFSEPTWIDAVAGFRITSDQGLTWTDHSLLDSGKESSRYGHNRSFQALLGDSLHLYLSTLMPPSITWFSEDAGNNFHPIDSLIQISNRKALVHIYLGHDSILFGDDGVQSWRSSDFGRTWSHIGQPVTSNLDYFSFKGDFGYAIAPHQIFYTSDNGQTWSAVDTLPRSPSSVQVTSDSNAYALVGAVLYQTRTHGVESDVEPQRHHDADALRVFPNPATESVTIESSTSDIHLYTIFGVELPVKSLWSANDKLDVHALSKGVYLIRSGYTITRLVIE
jgi:hypothetical protein